MRARRDAWTLVVLAAALYAGLAAPAVRAQDEEPQDIGALDEQEPAPADEEPASEEQTPAPAEQEPAPAEALRDLGLSFGVGAGIGTLAFERPRAAGDQGLPDTAFAATDVTLQLHAWPKRPIALDVLLTYQTSVGLELRLPVLFGFPEDVAMRLHRVELSGAPVFELGEQPGSFALAFPVGLMFRSLVPEVHQYDIANYDLGSALLRPELRIGLGRWLSLRLGPELQLIAVISRSLTDERACCSGYAFGGQGSLQLNAGAVVRIALDYRESHAFVPMGAWRFRDGERFVILRLGGEL